MQEERRREGHGQPQALVEGLIADPMQYERLVMIDDSWFYRVRGGQVVGPFATERGAAEAVSTFRAESMARIAGQLLWRPWRRPLGTRTRLQALRSTGT